jgi:HK97 family phage prohead protease
MSEVETIEEQETEAPDRGLLCRSFEAELTPGDGRTVDVRIVPYNETIEHNDGHGGVPKGVMYRERWMPGVFRNQERAPNRVLANFEHQEGIAGVVGHGKMLRETADGFYGSFKMHETPDGDKALMMVHEGILGGVSLEAWPVKGGSVRTHDGVIQRVKARLVGVAFTRVPAFSGSVVLAVREKADITDEIDPELLPVEVDPQLIERCRQLGVSLPARYQAHPAETDTPAEAGTSEDGTRHTHVTTSSEES